LNIAGLTPDQLEKVGQGSYLVNAVADCDGCHTAHPNGKFLAGGVPFGPVTSRNLTPDPATGYTLSVDQFVNEFRTGADYRSAPDGGAPNQTLIVMPWQFFRWMSTPDLQAIWWYLRSLPPVSNQIPADAKGPLGSDAGPTHCLPKGRPIPTT
jgi:hypothetical protein